MSFKSVSFLIIKIPCTNLTISNVTSSDMGMILLRIR